MEPRLGNQYGGKLALIFDDGTEAEVERIKGSAQGDVKVYLSDGSIRDESWLNKTQLHYKENVSRYILFQRFRVTRYSP